MSNNIQDRDQRTIRSDKITWVKGTEEGCSNIGYLINQVKNQQGFNIKLNCIKLYLSLSD